MSKFDGIFLCTDFDGTFSMPGPTVSRENCEAVRYFQQNGGRFTFASGRSPEFFGRFSDFRANAPIIAANGTMICDPDTFEKIAIFTMPDSTLEILDALARLPQTKKMYLCDSFGQGIEWDKAAGTPPSEVFGRIEKPWFKVLLHQSVEDTLYMRDYVRERYPGTFNVNRSYKNGIELHVPGSGKGECLRYLKSRDPSIRLTVGAGDYENDVSLIQMADIGYAVADAEPEARTAADRITVRCAEHAIARIISDIELLVEGSK
jgi:Cof subfamily protein (haloacid dehalogenase superfamily)